MVNKKFLLGFLVILSVFVFACSAQETVDDTMTERTLVPEDPIGVDDEEYTNYGDTLNDVDDGVVYEGEEVIDFGDNESLNSDVKTFNVVGGPMFEFFVDGERNADIIVNQGDTVKIVYESTGGMSHDFVVDEIVGARTDVWSPGQGETIEFVADVAGEFEYYCSVGAHRAQGMVGRFIVRG
ncbi:MAG: plastocyanin/azurin family copper-binding protein [Candidatus Woesearchaeota archaeon]